MRELSNVVAVVLCLGKAERMRPLSLGLPKHLIPFVGRPLITYMLNELARQGIGRVVLVTGPTDAESERLSECGQDHGLAVRVVQRGLGFGSAGVLKEVATTELAGEIQAGGDLLAVYGDSLLSFGDHRLAAMLDVHRAAKPFGGLMTVACHRPEDLVIPGRSHTDYGVLTLDAGGRVLIFREKPRVGMVFPLASAGVFLLDARVFALFPERRPADLSTDMISLAAGPSSAVFGFDISPGYRHDIGTLPAYLDQSLAVLRGRLPLAGTVPISDGCVIPDGAVLRDVVIGRGVVIGQGCRIEESVVHDSAVIGSGVRMSRTIVGPHARIGAGCCLEAGSVVGGWSVVNAPVSR